MVALSLLLTCGLQVLPAPLAVAPPSDDRFQRVQLGRHFVAEGIGVGDFDRDGNLDVTAGPHWWAGPQFTRRSNLYAPRTFPIGTYSDCFLVFVDDLDGDGFDDVIHVDFPGRSVRWYSNPASVATSWGAPNRLTDRLGIESPAYVDLNADGRRDLIGSVDGVLVWLDRDPADARRPWVSHRISAAAVFPVFTHGLGVGDIDGDGRSDVLTVVGWFQQPAILAGDPPWQFHPHRFGGGQGGAQMLVHDVDGDGDRDVISAINAHGYGLSWFEQTRTLGQIGFVEHVIQRAVPDPLDAEQFSQPHAMTSADVDGDGRVDFVSGKRFWAHNGLDPGARDPAVLTWFRAAPNSPPRFEPVRVAEDVGVGLQVVARDLDGDGDIDFAVANKKGIAVLLRR
ncbi:MAG: FG-GAP repeat domain-containing protein [Planctomycetota bacterium]